MQIDGLSVSFIKTQASLTDVHHFLLTHGSLALQRTVLHLLLEQKAAIVLKLTLAYQTSHSFVTISIGSQAQSQTSHLQ